MVVLLGVVIFVKVPPPTAAAVPAATSDTGARTAMIINVRMARPGMTPPSPPRRLHAESASAPYRCSRREERESRGGMDEAGEKGPVTAAAFAAAAAESGLATYGPERLSFTFGARGGDGWRMAT